MIMYTVNFLYGNTYWREALYPINTPLQYTMQAYTGENLILKQSCILVNTGQKLYKLLQVCYSIYESFSC